MVGDTFVSSPPLREVFSLALLIELTYATLLTCKQVTGKRQRQKDERDKGKGKKHGQAIHQ
jgi:hypothetical protein